MGEGGGTIRCFFSAPVPSPLCSLHRPLSGHRIACPALRSLLMALALAAGRVAVELLIAVVTTTASEAGPAKALSGAAIAHFRLRSARVAVAIDAFCSE